MPPDRRPTRRPSAVSNVPSQRRVRLQWLPIQLLTVLSQRSSSSSSSLDSMCHSNIGEAAAADAAAFAEARRAEHWLREINRCWDASKAKGKTNLEDAEEAFVEEEETVEKR
ncbi:hypothetical protein F3Y22_tig00112354pilonHSYRG00106 [Hibiscus syriacus]|uniref:Uncharacterized protein n=1 Tax=Hibiscus syriacus TaxID=106335 RepID=A0A6A2X045_HIBSY|nr:hypothetical protein F3Y22_tig00112354pilonHSYRG00106 [Hibiscus syriacus]